MHPTLAGCLLVGLFGRVGPVHCALLHAPYNRN